MNQTSITPSPGPLTQPAVRVIPELSIVTCLYKSASFIETFYQRTTAIAGQITSSYEIVFVNDGSPDTSLDLVIALAKKDARVRVVDLSRNFGHHAAALAGLRTALGNRVFLIDVDLEEQPEWLVDFWRDLEEGGGDMVYGVQTVRGGSFLKRYSGSLFYFMFNLTSDTAIPVNVCTVRLMNRPYVDAITSLTETQIFLAGLCSWTGFKQRARPVAKMPRPGKSTYTPLKLIRLFLTAISSFSSYPLTVVFYSGAVITLISIAYAGSLLFRKLLHPDALVSGFASILISIWFLGGAILTAVGIIGIYIGRIFIQVKDRPQYLIREIFQDLVDVPPPSRSAVASTTRGKSGSDISKVIKAEL